MRLIFLFLFLNLLALDGFIIYNFFFKKEKQTGKAAATSIYSNSADSNNSSVNSEECSDECQANIAQEVLDTLKLTPTAKPAQSANIIFRNPTSAQTQSSIFQSTVKEFFVPLGSGSITATDWTDVPGVKAEINGSNYGSVKQILFETTVHVPNANQIVEVRLFNETDSYVVGNSTLTYPSGTTENFRITAIQLSSGAKTYKVQMKTQLGQTAILDQARIHINTN